MNLNILINIKKEHPKIFWTAISTLATVIIAIAAISNIKSCQMKQKELTPKLEILKVDFVFYPDKEGNRTGIFITIVNQNKVWAKNVMVDFVNHNAVEKKGRIAELRKYNRIVNPRDIPPYPEGKITDGWLMLEGFDQLEKYRNNEKTYKVTVFINWEDDEGRKYSLVAGYESLADNYRQVQFKPVYKNDTFRDKKKVAEIKEANKDYLPVDMIK